MSELVYVVLLDFVEDPSTLVCVLNGEPTSERLLECVRIGLQRLGNAMLVTRLEASAYTEHDGGITYHLLGSSGSTPGMQPDIDPVWTVSVLPVEGEHV